MVRESIYDKAGVITVMKTTTTTVATTSALLSILTPFLDVN
jgi:hypothetical protein